MAPLFIVNKGNSYNLPTFPQHVGKKYNAIVTGANGITGSALVEVLAASPERWNIIFAMSRRPASRKEVNVKSMAADFLTSPEELAATFVNEGVKAYVKPQAVSFKKRLKTSGRDYVFFASYVQPPATEAQGLWGNVEELEEMNGTQNSFKRLP